MEYSKRLGEISNDQLQKALDKFDLGNLVESSPISQGLFGQNLFITTTKGEFVLRGVPHYDWQFPSEKFFAELLHKNTSVPVPYPYLFDDDKSIFGWPYIIMPKMKGRNLSDNLEETDLSDNDRIEIAQLQGKILAELQILTWEFTGKFDLVSKTIVPFEPDYFSWFQEYLWQWVNSAKKYNSNTTDDDIAWIKDTLIEVEPFFLNVKPVFVMQDYKPGNMVVDKIDGKWEITGLFDLMECYFGHEESDLARMFCVYINKGRADLGHEFVNSYIKNKESINVDELIRRFSIFVILDRSIVWEWHQRKGNQIGKSFKEWVKSYLNLNILRSDL
jgi:hygromycin-B 7''-O-kinase